MKSYWLRLNFVEYSLCGNSTVPTPGKSHSSYYMGMKYKKKKKVKRTIDSSRDLNGVASIVVCMIPSSATSSLMKELI
jgi:hypothetical protein